MEIENHTLLPARLWRTVIDDQRIAAAAIVRATYRIEEERLHLDPEQVWRVSSTPWDSPVGVMPADDCFRRRGVDLLVFGSACAPRCRPAHKVDVRIVIGNWVGGVDVFGDRTWSCGLWTEPRASEPSPFVKIPLTLAYTFGGGYEWDGLHIPHSTNPTGKGWYVDARSADGQPLANIEDPRRPVQRWSDHPDPVGVGLCPGLFGPRIIRNVDFDDAGILRRLDPGLFNDAFPDLVAPRANPGDRCAVHGVRHDGPLVFELPPSPVKLRLRFGPRCFERDLQIDQIGIEPEIGRVFVTYRFQFRYHVVRMQKRSCELCWCPRPLQTT